MKTAFGREILSLISDHQVTAAQAQADIDNAVASQILTSAQATSLWSAATTRSKAV
jgi:hypothetical protein